MHQRREAQLGGGIVQPDTLTSPVGQRDYYLPHHADDSTNENLPPDDHKLPGGGHETVAVVKARISRSSTTTGNWENATSLAGVRDSHITSVVEKLQSWNEFPSVAS
jgi:hypothetical protein